MENGKVAITFLPQYDGARKNRPALVLFRTKPYGDYVVCGISTQMHTATTGFDEVLNQQSTDFSSSGLVSPSVIRTLFLGTVAPKDIKGFIGKISEERYYRITSNLALHFQNLSRKLR
jgi:mRNA interferase MazF